jgi:hypothetical protein
MNNNYRIFYSPGYCSKGESQFSKYKKNTNGYCRNDECLNIFNNNNEYFTFNFDEINKNIFHTNIAGKQDIKLLRYNLINFLIETKLKNKKAILMGVSRGASALYIVLSLLNQDDYYSYLLQYIHSIILEAPFSSINSIIKYYNYTNIFSYLFSYIPLKILTIIGLYFTNYDPYQLSPLDVSKYYPNFISTIIIGSKKDDIVPFLSINELVNATKNVKFLILNYSNHRSYWNNYIDKHYYRETILKFLY